MSRAPLVPLQAFVLAARLRNLSRAAEQMHLTVSALSHQIRALEERLCRRLFERGPRGVKLTLEGERLLDAVGGPLDAIERALKPYRERRGEQLTLSMMATFASSWLLPRLPCFVAKHPELELNLQSSIDLVDFDRDGVDAAMRFGRGHWPGLRAEHLFDEWITPVAAPELIERLGRKALRDLPRAPLLGDPGGRWKDWFATHGGEPPKRYVANFTDSETLQRAALEGLGVALIRLTMAQPLIDAGKLVLLTEARMRAEYAHYLVYPERAVDHPGLRVFREWLLAQARSYHAASTPAGAAGSAKRAARKPG